MALATRTGQAGTHRQQTVHPAVVARSGPRTRPARNRQGQPANAGAGKGAEFGWAEAEAADLRGKPAQATPPVLVFKNPRQRVFLSCGPEAPRLQQPVPRTHPVGSPMSGGRIRFASGPKAREMVAGNQPLAANGVQETRPQKG